MFEFIVAFDPATVWQLKILAASIGGLGVLGFLYWLLF